MVLPETQQTNKHRNTDKTQQPTTPTRSQYTNHPSQTIIYNSQPVMQNQKLLAKLEAVYSDSLRQQHKGVGGAKVR
jgi:hypothetical protein